MSARLPAMKPCPFCGALPTMRKIQGGLPSRRLIGCGDFGCFVNPSLTGRTPRLAIERWNTRAVKP